jgi:hypothetical protein
VGAKNDNVALTLSFVIRQVLPRVNRTGTDRLVTQFCSQSAVSSQHAGTDCTHVGLLTASCCV